MYNPVTKDYLNSIQDAPSGFWVPFTTIVPAVGDWPEKDGHGLCPDERL